MLDTHRSALCNYYTIYVSYTRAATKCNLRLCDVQDRGVRSWPRHRVAGAQQRCGALGGISRRALGSGVSRRAVLARSAAAALDSGGGGALARKWRPAQAAAATVRWLGGSGGTLGDGWRRWRCAQRGVEQGRRRRWRRSGDQPRCGSGGRGDGGVATVAAARAVAAARVAVAKAAAAAMAIVEVAAVESGGEGGEGREDGKGGRAGGGDRGGSAEADGQAARAAAVRARTATVAIARCARRAADLALGTRPAHGGSEHSTGEWVRRGFERRPQHLFSRRKLPDAKQPPAGHAARAPGRRLCARRRSCCTVSTSQSEGRHSCRML